MRRPVSVLMIVLGLVFGVLACQRLQEGAPSSTVDQGIPGEYGRLVAVTVIGSKGWVRLWFESEDHTINAVNVNPEMRLLAPGVLSIPRN